MTSKPNKILFLVPDGVGVRNYLYSDIIAQLKQTATVCVWSSLPKEAFESVEKLHDIKIEHHFLPLKKQSIATKIATESATYARLLSNAKLVDNPTIMFNWNNKGINFKQVIQKKISKRLGLWASKKYNRILWLEKISDSFWSSKVIASYEKQLKALQPSVVFITHQRVAALMPICLAANALKIKVVSAIYSWDNLPKARLAVKADYYLVWSDYMKKEMELYYPEIAPEKVVVTGTPQFEFYTKKDTIVSREAFAAIYNLDVAKKWLCFSGNDALSSPYDHQYLEDVADTVATMEAGKRPEIIFRKSPADVYNRFTTILAKHSSFITAIEPVWENYGEGWGSNFPKIEDVSLLVNLAFHCDVVVNIGSTMAHDFAIYNKPCLYLNYNQTYSAYWNVETIYNFQHFRSMGDLDAVGWITNKKAILEKINEALESPLSIASQRKLWIERVVRHPLEESSELIAAVLLQSKTGS